MEILTFKQRLKEIKKIQEQALFEYCDLVIEKLTKKVNFDDLLSGLNRDDEGMRWVNIWDDCYDLFGYTPTEIEDLLDNIQNNLDISSLLHDNRIITIDVDEEKRILTYEIIKV